VLQDVLDGPVSFDLAADGRAAVLDRGGRRLLLDGVAHELAFVALRCRLLGASVLLLDADGALVTLRSDGAPAGRTMVPPGVVNVAVTPSGSVLVSRVDHRPLVERLGGNPDAFDDDALPGAPLLTPESGGVWIAGGAHALLLRPDERGFAVRARAALPGDARAGAIGPDGALYALLEPGDGLVRIRAGAVSERIALPSPATELARAGRRLWACGDDGLFECTDLVPRPDGDLAPPDLPACGT
jgi:hypothetical protein